LYPHDMFPVMLSPARMSRISTTTGQSRARAVDKRSKCRAVQDTFLVPQGTVHTLFNTGCTQVMLQLAVIAF
jgi:hypothetical protein